MAHLLVTGGAGFIGSHLCERLLHEGRLVTCLDNLDPYYPSDAKRVNIAQALQSGSFRFVEGDILDSGLVDAVLTGRSVAGPVEARAEASRGGAGRFREPVTAVVHLAALAGVRPSTERPLRYMRVNVEGTANLLERARRAGVRHFVFASSSSVYGLSEGVPYSEYGTGLLPASLYGASKHAGELVCQAFHHLHELPVTVLRFFTVYGPRQRPDMAIHKFARLMLSGEPVPLYGDGSSARDYTYVGDIVEGLVGALDHPGSFQVFNLGSACPVRLDELVEKLGAALGVEPRFEHYPDQPGDVKITWADISKAEQVLGHRPRTSLTEGLERFVNWMREQQEAPRERFS